MKAWRGNKALCTQLPYDLGKFELKSCTEHTKWTYPKIGGPNDACTGSDYYYIKLQGESSTNHTNNTRLVV